MNPIICSVARAGARPILFLPRGKAAGTWGDALPKGDVPVRVDGRTVTASVAKIAVNVMRDDTGANVLPAILKAWFGESAGMPGHRARVQFRKAGGHWVMEPVTPAETRAA